MTEKEMTALATSVGADAGQSSQSIHTDSISQTEEENKGFDDFSYDFRREWILANDTSYLKTVTMDELYDTTFDVNLPIIDGVLYPGTYLFAGPSKVGKSFLMAQLAYHVSTGTELWGNAVRKGTVLYLALEDDYARLQRRLYRMFGTNTTPNLHLATEARVLGDGFDEQIKAFIRNHPDTRLIIIDVLQRVRDVGGKDYSYASDYEIVAKLKAMTDGTGVALLIVHHRVFAAYLHMDEATPHLHIDFIPFTTGSKRGLETRVSLKSALAQQGITGGTKLETEWNLFVGREKEQLALIMERHGVGWKKLGTHEKHLSVLDYEKKMRTQEVAELTVQVGTLQDSKDELEEEISEAEAKRKALSDEIEGLRAMADEVEMETYKYYNDPEWQLPEPKALTGAKAYKEKTAAPFVEKLKNVIIALVSKIKDLMREYNRKLHELQSERSYSRRLEQRNQVLQRDSDILQTIRDEIGNDGVEEILDRAQQRAEEEAELYEQERSSRDRGFSMEL